MKKAMTGSSSKPGRRVGRNPNPGTPRKVGKPMRKPEQQIGTALQFRRPSDPARPKVRIKAGMKMSPSRPY